MNRLTMSKNLKHIKNEKKAFTLTELLAVIAILGIIALIVFPSVNKTVQNSKQKAYNQQVKSITKSAENWGIENANSLSETEDTYLTLTQLQASGYLESKEIINPITNELMDGCVVATYLNEYHQYTYNYHETTCSDLEQNGVVARIETTTYATLKDAINAVTTSEPTTIVMLKDVTLTASETISEDQNITLDLDGYTITNVANECMFWVYGDFSLDSEKGGTLKHESDEKVAIANAGNLTINNGTLIANDSAIIKNNGGNVITNGGNFVGYEGIWNTESNGVITINNGNFENDRVIDNELGTTIVNGGTLTTDTYQALVNREIMKVNGGTIKSTSLVDEDGGYYSMIRNYNQLTIENGKFESGEVPAISNKENGILTINGGNFNVNSAESVLNNESNEPLTIAGGTFTNNGVGKVIRNEMAGTITIENATITASSGDLTGEDMIYSASDCTGEIIIKNGTELTSDTHRLVRNNGLGTITIEGGTFQYNSSSEEAIYNNGNGNIIISGGTFTSQTDIVYNRQYGKVEVSGGNYTLTAGDVFVNGSISYTDGEGTIEITGGNYNLFGGSFVYNIVNGSVSVSGIEIDETNSTETAAADFFYNSYSSDYTGTITVNDCIIKSKESRIFYNRGNGTVNINNGEYEINDGNFVQNRDSGKINISGNIHVVSNAPTDADGTWYAMFRNANIDGATGEIVINDGMFESTTTGILSNRQNGVITINGGTYQVNIEKSEDSSLPIGVNYANSKLIVNGGTFKNIKGSIFWMDSIDTDGDGLLATENTTIILGDATKEISIETPKFISLTENVVEFNIGNVQFNNGIMVASNPLSQESNVTYRSGATLMNGTETIDGVTLNTLYFE